MVGLMHQLSQVNGNTICPEMIVVGTPNTDRTKDLTPTYVDSDPPFMDTIFAKTSGGGEEFVSFIKNELIPHIDSKYPTQPYKMLIGHSFGGLTVVNILMNHTKLFNSYICIDPSKWWDKMNFLKTTKKSYAERTLLVLLFIWGLQILWMRAWTLIPSKKILQVRQDTFVPFLIWISI
jgi:predicted alpha/beta superfamily hydrolase